MPLDATLLEMLACPSDDHAPLRERERDGAAMLVCTYCASSFPIEDGIPVLLLDEARPGPNGIGVAAPASPSPRPGTGRAPQHARPPAHATPEASVPAPPEPPSTEPAEAEPVLDDGPGDATPQQATDSATAGAHEDLDAEPPMDPVGAPTASAPTASAPTASALTASAPTASIERPPPTTAPQPLQQALARAGQLRRLVQDRVEERVERGPDGRPRLKRRGPGR